jgi:hypothetical protein
MPDYMIKKLVPFVVATILVTINSLLPALAKPAKIKEGVSFDLEACRRTLDGNDVVCTGTLLSRNGEQTITISRHQVGHPEQGSTYITTPQGKTHGASEILVGQDQVCRPSDNYSIGCSGFNVTLVEGVRYNSSFTFRDVSPTSSRIALLTIAFNGGFGDNYQPQLKYRNLSIFQMR